MEKSLLGAVDRSLRPKASKSSATVLEWWKCAGNGSSLKTPGFVKNSEIMTHKKSDDTSI
jgi:hypothetical protein